MIACLGYSGWRDCADPDELPKPLAPRVKTFCKPFHHAERTAAAMAALRKAPLALR